MREPTSKAEPDEASLPPKPAIRNMPPEEGLEPPAEEEERDVKDSEFLDPKVARRDDTVDDEEGEDT